MAHFKAALMYISLRKKLHYYPSSIITHKNLSTTPFITCNTCYSFSCLGLRKATERRNLYELRRISEQIKSRYLQLHPLMRDSYRQASHVIQELQQREDIRRKLGNLDMKTVISELSRYNQLPGGDVMAVMQAMFVLLGVREQDVKVFEPQHVISNNVAF